MLEQLRTVLYVQIWKHRLRVTNVPRGDRFDEVPQLAIQHRAAGKSVVVGVGNLAAAAARETGATLINPFEHPRTIIADFTSAEKLLQYAFRAVQQGRWRVFTPRVVMHPMEALEGGLTPIEERALLELAVGAGARDVILWTGPELSAGNLDFKALKARANASRPSRGE